jgi:hypothetical protein
MGKVIPAGWPFHSAVQTDVLLAGKTPGKGKAASPRLDEADRNLS